MIQKIKEDGNSYNTLKGQLQIFKTMKIINFQIVIRDFYAVASFDDPYFARKMVRNENRHGNMNIKYSEQINSAIEHFPGKKKEEITKLVAKKLRDGGAILQ